MSAMPLRSRNPRGEMPFLDHLEELRWRILWSLLAIAVCAGLLLSVVGARASSFLPVLLAVAIVLLVASSRVVGSGPAVR